MITIIFSHPKHTGFNGKIYHAILDHCQQTGIEYTAIDLYREGFSPLLTEEELDGFYNGLIYTSGLIGAFLSIVGLSLNG